MRSDNMYEKDKRVLRNFFRLEPITAARLFLSFMLHCLPRDANPEIENGKGSREMVPTYDEDVRLHPTSGGSSCAVPCSPVLRPVLV